MQRYVPFQNVSFLVAFVVPAAAIFVVFVISFFAVKDVDCRKDDSG